MKDSIDSPGPQGADNSRWLLFIHHLPPKPDYFRVRVRRRLHDIGAVQLKASVYVLPSSEDCMEDLQWLYRQVIDGGGEAMLFSAASVAGVSDPEIESMFRAQSDEEYAAIEAAAGEITDSPSETEVARLQRLLSRATARDFFGAAGRAKAVRAVEAVEQRHETASRSSGEDSSGSNASGRARPVAAGSHDSADAPKGALWVTRAGVHVDRIASAWLIRRFIDESARFRFVRTNRYSPAEGELRFDMYEGEFTHEGDACTFEVLVSRFVPDDSVLRVIGEIVHDIDFKEDRYGRGEAPGVATVIRGICAVHEDDPARLEAGAGLFDGLYASLSLQ